MNLGKIFWIGPILNLFVLERLFDWLGDVQNIEFLVGAGEERGEA